MTDPVAEAVLGSRAEAIIAADRHGHITFWNPGAERVFGYAAASAMGQSLDLIIPERLRQRHWEGYNQVISSGRSRYGEADVLSVPALRSDGSTISIEFTIVPLKDAQQRVTGMVAIIRDVTQRFAELRELKKKLAEAQRT
ncbi:MAG TPA: PAS domain S-box protein [Steroidobacteraceae bacterium]|nr:PAS domain S-box protein [Steroidobacteraceae bacterium]